MKIVSVVLLVLFVMSAAVSGAFAQVCSKDVAKFCANLKPVEGRISRCLGEHEAQLSPACKTHRAQLKEAIKTTEQTCKDDITKYCAGQKGQSRLIECLIAKKSQLSPNCRTKVVEAERKSKE